MAKGEIYSGFPKNLIFLILLLFHSAVSPFECGVIGEILKMSKKPFLNLTRHGNLYLAVQTESQSRKHNINKTQLFQVTIKKLINGLGYNVVI